MFAPIHSLLNYLTGTTQCLDEISANVVPRLGVIPCSGRCHSKPRKLEDDYVVSSDVVGTGLNGNVMLASSKTDPSQQFAVKKLVLHHDHKRSMDQVKSEVQNYLLLDHPHIARLHDVYESDEHLYLVMECMEGGELYHRVQATKQFSEEDARDVVRQVLLALNYMHSQGIVHRDVKLENVVYDKTDGKLVKLIDFGLSKAWTPQSGQHMRQCVGTRTYVAPEVFKKNYTSQCDMWSLGVVGFALLSGYMPFTGSDTEITSKACAGTYTMRSSRWSNVSADGIDFIQALLNVNPSERLSAQQALEHPWMVEIPRTPRFEGMSEVLVDLCNFSCYSKFRRCCMRMMALSLSTKEQNTMWKCFLALDQRQQGSIMLKDLKIVMNKYLKSISDDEISQVFESLDYNQDLEIQFSDFLAAVLCKRIDLKEGLLTSAFRRMDKVGYGCITPEQLQHTVGCADAESLNAAIHDVDKESKGHICFEDFQTYLKNDPPAVTTSFEETVDVDKHSVADVGLLRSIFNVALIPFFLV